MARLTTRDRIRNLTQPGRYSQRELARVLGISARTVGRVIRGERKLSPQRYPRDVFDVLRDVDHEVRTIERRELRRRGVRLPDMPVQFPAERNRWRDPLDPSRMIDGDTVEYNIEKAEEDTRELATDREREILRLLKFYRTKASMAGELGGVRFLVTTTRYRGRRVTHWWPPRTEDQPDISDMSDEDLKDLIAELALYIGPSGELHKLRIVDATLKV